MGRTYVSEGTDVAMQRSGLFCIGNVEQPSPYFCELHPRCPAIFHIYHSSCKALNTAHWVTAALFHLKEDKSTAPNFKKEASKPRGI